MSVLESKDKSVGSRPGPGFSSSTAGNPAVASRPPSAEGSGEAPGGCAWPRRYLEVLQHGALLGKEQRAVRALEDADPLVEQMLVEVGGEQGLVGEDRVAHRTLVNHSAAGKGHCQHSPGLGHENRGGHPWAGGPGAALGAARPTPSDRKVKGGGSQLSARVLSASPSRPPTRSAPGSASQGPARRNTYLDCWLLKPGCCV